MRGRWVAAVVGFVVAGLQVGVPVPAAAALGSASGSGNVVVVRVESDLDSAWVKMVEASCPAGTVLYGGGGRVAGGSGLVDLLQLLPGDPAAKFDPTGQGHHHFAGFVPEDGSDRSFRTEAEGPGGTDRALGSWAICIDA